MIKGEVIGGERTAANLNALPAEIRDGLHSGIGRACLLVQTRAKQDKLSGQVLNVRTGRLRRSVTHRIEDSDTKVTGIVGTNVEYAGIHEFGFQGVVSVREHLRHTKASRRLGRRQLDGTRKGGGTVGDMATVRAHSRQVNMPERSFLRSSLGELAPDIRQAVAEGISVKLRRRT